MLTIVNGLKKTAFSLITLSLLLLSSCSKSEQPLSGENKILSYSIDHESVTYNGQIDHSTKKIFIDMGDLGVEGNYTPIIEISPKASIDPDSYFPISLATPYSYTVTAENGEEAVYTAQATSSENKVLSYSITYDNTVYEGQIDHEAKTITLNTTGLEMQPHLIPSMTISADASVVPGSGEAINFMEDVKITVTAHNGEQTVYDVIVNNTPLATGNSVLSFSLTIQGLKQDAEINDETGEMAIILTRNEMYNLEVDYQLSEGATITPAPESIYDYDYRQPQTFTVTAENGVSRQFTLNPLMITFNFYSTIKAYSNARLDIGTYNMDPTVQGNQVIIENATHSYEMNYEIENVNDLTVTPGFSIYAHYTFPEDVVTGVYDIKYKVNGETISTGTAQIDVLSEDPPVITATNQEVYQRGDTLVITGTNLVPGLIFHAFNANKYAVNDRYITVNEEGTELIMVFDSDWRYMFPSYQARDDYDTRIDIHYNGRQGVSIVKTFD